MNKKLSPLRLSRRNFLKLGGGAVAAAAGARLLPGIAGHVLQPASKAVAATLEIHLAATDGFIYLPGSVSNIHPDPLASAPFTTYTFGFRDVTGLTAGQIQDQRGKVQASAPLLWVDELDDVKITLTNLGLVMRPDLTDGHTIHWHGFRNAIPLFDGVPELSIGVPISRDFTYFYRPREPGTYMYHCHFEDVEHVSMGMTGIIFVRPGQNGNTTLYPSGKYAYNDGDGSTGYDREFGLILTELWTQERFNAVHIQEHDWSEYNPDFWLLNGRTYPDTLAPNGPGRSPVTGDLLAPPTPYESLQYQPISSLVTANSGDRVLLRFVNLGYQQHAMTLDGIPMRVVGKDATLLRGRDGADLSYQTNTIYIGPGESVDAIFEAPVVSSQTTYQLYNRNYAYLHSAGVSGLGGQMTEVRISPSGVPLQTTPNT
jgi:FtsP/CotA-like multicopper oxidase with cupredoxin domain